MEISARGCGDRDGLCSEVGEVGNRIQSILQQESLRMMLHQRKERQERNGRMWHVKEGEEGKEKVKHGKEGEERKVVKTFLTTFIITHIQYYIYFCTEMSGSRGIGQYFH